MLDPDNGSYNNHPHESTCTDTFTGKYKFLNETV